MKINILQYTGAIVLGLVLQVNFAHAGVEEAVTYLQSQEDSAMKSTALIVAGESTDIAFLKATETSSSLEIVKPIMALVAAGEDPSTYPHADLVDALLGHFDGTQMGDAGIINDDIWAILALVAAGEANNDIVSAMADFVLENQNVDGGWSWGVDVSSDTDDTAVAVMALLASGLPKTHASIVDARTYILGNQNDDGGFLSNPDWGSDSNSATTAWVLMMINALDEDVTAWKKNDNSPVDYILTLQDTDGGFWWVAEGTSEWNNKLGTADVVIALLGHSLPTHVFTAKSTNDSGVDVTYRFEGQAEQVCKGEVKAVTVKEVVDLAAIACPFTHTYTEFDFGSMLTTINADTGNWMYFVNDMSAMVGAADYVLTQDDSVLWYFAGQEWGWLPTRLVLDDSGVMSVGDSLSGKVEYYDESNSQWKALESATVKLDGSSHTTDASGAFALDLPTAGVFEIVADKDGYVRTDTETIIVSETSNGVALSVDIVQSQSTGEGPTNSDAIGLTVTPASLSFGQIVPGQRDTQSVTLSNTGTAALDVKVQVLGNSVFHFLRIADVMWSAFETVLGISEEQTHNIELAVPTTYTAYGNKQGSLIFWATKR